MKLLATIGVLAMALVGCGQHLADPYVPSPLVLSIWTDSATAHGTRVGAQYQCTMTFKALGNVGRDGDVATFTGGTLTIAPKGGTAADTPLTADEVSAFFGVTEVKPGEAIPTQQVISSSGPFTSTLVVRYTMDGAAKETLPSSFTCT